MPTVWRRRNGPVVPATGETGRVVAVTGAAGRVGAACLRALSDTDDTVIAVDRVRGIGPGQWRRADLRKADAAHRALRGATHVIHLAGHKQPDPQLGWRVLADNVSMTTNVLDALDSGPAGTAVLASTFCVYGFVFEPRIRSPRYLPVDEDHPVGAADPYGTSKILIEHLARAWTQRTGATSVSLRFPWTAGLDEPTEITRYLGGLLDDPHSAMNRGCLWASVHIDDLADAFVRSLGVADGAAHVLNIASPWVPGDVPLSQLAALDHPTSRRRADLDACGPLDTTRARELLGWEPLRTYPGPTAPG